MDCDREWELSVIIIAPLAPILRMSKGVRIPKNYGVLPRFCGRLTVTLLRQVDSYPNEGWRAALRGASIWFGRCAYPSKDGFNLFRRSRPRLSEDDASRDDDGNFGSGIGRADNRQLTSDPGGSLAHSW